MNADLTLIVAFAAGVISFLSPCVLPLVPAYLGQLTAVAVAAAASGTTPSRWTALPHAMAYVAGFGAGEASPVTTGGKTAGNEHVWCVRGGAGLDGQ